MVDTVGEQVAQRLFQNDRSRINFEACKRMKFESLSSKYGEYYIRSAIVNGSSHKCFEIHTDTV